MSKAIENKIHGRLLRKARVRARVQGSAEIPRLSVFISNRHVSVQAIDDQNSRTLASAFSPESTVSMTEKCAALGSVIAKKLKKTGVTRVVFDRNGRQYSGRLKALAEAARKEGLEF